MRDHMRDGTTVFRPPGIFLPFRMRELYMVVIHCTELKQVTFFRRQVETKTTTHNPYTERIYPRHKGINKEIKPKHGASTDDLKRLRRALKTMEYKPSIDLEKNTERWEVE